MFRDAGVTLEQRVQVSLGWTVRRGRHRIFRLFGRGRWEAAHFLFGTGEPMSIFMFLCGNETRHRLRT